MDEYTHLLQLILDVGVELIQSGAETHRVEDSLYRLCSSYGFTNCNIWVIPSNIQATVTTPVGNCTTQIRHIRQSGIDFAKLEDLNALSRRLCEEKPSPELFSTELLTVTHAGSAGKWTRILAGVLAGGGFGIFFNCDWLDAIAAACTSIIATILCCEVGKRERNPLIANFLIAFCSEVFIIFAVKIGLGHHVGYIAAGVVMLLISALGTTNGIRDLMRLDTLSGIMNISLSLTGAIGIAAGIILPLRLFLHEGVNEIMILNPNVGIELIACTVGCVGFSLWFHVKKRHIFWCALGAFLTWGAYSICCHFTANSFWSTLFGAVACGFYAQIMARVNRAPATIFQTVAIFPMIPGAALYYSVYGLVMGDFAFAASKGLSLLLSCFGIVIGFLFVAVASRFIWPTSNVPQTR